MGMTNKILPYKSRADFLFNAPLYKKFSLESEASLFDLYCCTMRVQDDTVGTTTVDGFCKDCRQVVPFNVQRKRIVSGTEWDSRIQRNSIDEIKVSCGRIPSHHINFFVKIENMTVQKIGQFPSLVDVAFDEFRTKYNSVLDEDNFREIRKAIGLAAHGEGIASFVFLRRIFERLIFSRFSDHKLKESWDEIKFKILPMDQKLVFLRDFLPEFLIKNSKLYKILSKGIHELTDSECLGFFEIGKFSIAIILDEDIRLRQEKASKDDLSNAISKFTPAEGV
jgi:hypothetical protein